MEDFKKALKQAIVDKAEAVRFEEDQYPSLVLFSNEKPLNQLNVSSEADVKALIEGLIAAGVDIADNAKEGVLSIVNFGELKLLAQLSGPARLFAFIPPQGNSLYQQIKNQMLMPAGGKKTPGSIDFLPDAPSEDSGEDGGNFALNNLTDYKRAPQESVPPTMDFASMEPSIPPFAKRSFDTQTKVSGVPAKPEFGGVPSEVNLRAAPPSLQEAMEYTSSDDDFRYAVQAKADELPPAFHTSVSNQAGVGTVPPMRPDAIPQAMAYQSPMATAAPAPVHVAPVSAAPVASNVIHFGSFIPGETIERSGSFPIDRILQDMVKRKASDLHMTMGEPMCYRVDGDIMRVGNEPISEAQMREFLLPIMPPKNREEFSKISDTDFAYEVPGLARFRVNIFRDRMGVGCVMRQIPDKVLSADDLGLPAAVRKFCELHKGLVVVTGPTGSGKSTTLAGMVDLINETRTDHILTIEDPIEFVHKQKRCLLNQREVHKHTTSFARALKAALREDPDIILIGEMRDLETVAIAIETAETGHLVFGTLHTNTAISTVDRLIDQFPADQQEQVRVMLAESLKGVVAQTLVKKKGGGRCAAQEILVVDKAVSSLIREGNTHMVQNHMQTQKAKGNITLNDSLMALIQKGLVDPKDAYAKAIEKEAFAAMLQKAGITFEGLKTAS